MVNEQDIIKTLEGYEFSYTCEEELQKAIASALTASSIPHQREYRLNERDRLDFKVETIAIEVKVKGSLTETVRQVARYLLAPEIHSLIVVTTKAAHRGLPQNLNGKPIFVLYLPPL